MKRLFGFFSAVFFLLMPVFAESAGAADLKVGWIDVQQVIVSSKQGQEANRKIEARAMEYKKKFVAEKARVDEMKKKLESLKTVGNDDSIRSQERAIDRKLQELDLESKYAAKDMKELQKKKLEPVIDELNEVISELGRSGKYDYILDSRTLLFAGERTNITDKVIEAMNKRFDAAAKK